MQRFARKHYLFSLLVTVVWLLGCPPREPEKFEESAVNQPPVVLLAGESGTFEFPADGQWHDSPFMAQTDQVLQLRPVGAAQGLSPQAIRFRIASVPQLITPERSFSVTMPGRIAFRAVPKFCIEHDGPITVEITRNF